MTTRFQAAPPHPTGSRPAFTRRGHPALIALLGGFVALAGIAQAPSVQARSSAALPLHFLSEPIPMAIAGHSAELRVVRAETPPHEALDAVAEVWQRESGLIQRHADGPWLNLSRIDRGGLQALQLRSSGEGGSEGYLVDWRLAASPSMRSEATESSTAARAGVAMQMLPVGARILSDLASGDPPRGRTLVAWVDVDVAQADRQTLARAQAAGLQPLRNAGPGDSGSGGELSRQFSGPGFDYAITLHEQGRGTALVVHQMEVVR